MARRSPDGEPVTEVYICATLTAVLAAGFITDTIGIHALFGAFIVGIFVPKDGPFAGILIEKIEDLVSGLFLPLYFASSGLKTNVATISDAKSWLLLLLVIVNACLGKIAGTVVTVYAMHLMELSERSSAICMVHKARRNGLPFWNKKYNGSCDGNSDGADLIVVAFEAFRQLSSVAIRPMTAISDLHTIHEDVTGSAEGKRAALVLLPFHKVQRLDGTMESLGHSYQHINQKVLGGGGRDTSLRMAEPAVEGEPRSFPELPRVEHRKRKRRPRRSILRRGWEELRRREIRSLRRRGGAGGNAVGGK